MENILSTFEDYCKQELAKHPYQSTGGTIDDVKSRLNEKIEIAKKVNPKLTEKANELFAGVPKEQLDSVKKELSKIAHKATDEHYFGLL